MEAPMLVTGARGTLAQAFARECKVRGLPLRLMDRQSLDITDAGSARAAIERWKPWALINTAGYVRVDEAEHDDRQWCENAEGPVALARVCAENDVRLVTFSSDLVFGGNVDRRTPYRESDPAEPLSAYGRAKAHAEHHVIGLCPDALVIRTAAFFGPHDRYNFVTLALDALRRGQEWVAVEDQMVSPTYVPHLVHTTLELLVDGESGIWHLANRGAVSWAELARVAARAAGLDESLVRGVSTLQLHQIAPRPSYAVLTSERGDLMPSLDEAMTSYFREVAEVEETGVVERNVLSA